jgi:lipoprotein-anchoring transpeptidase ErfK/SrfK
MVSVSAVARRRLFGACSFSTLLAAVATVALGLQPTPAAARGFFDWFESDPPRSEPGRYWGPQSYPRAAPEAYGRRHSKTAGARQRREAKPAEISSLERPLFAVISIADQRVSIYNHRGLVERSAISTGMAGHPTPKGVFTIIGRERFHHSNIYAGAPMPFMQRITWSGIAMHLGVVPGHPASHGCIRLPAGFAAKLWGLTKIGERVVISPQDVTPVEFTHPLLPAPRMQVQTVANGAEAPALGSPQASDVPAQPPLINPHQYAEQLKGNAAADAAAALKASKEMSAAISVKRQEAYRAEAELEAAEAAHDSAQAKADAATRAYEAVAAASAAKQQGLIPVAELNSAGGDICDSADARRPTKDDELAVTAKYAAETAKLNAEAALAEAAAKVQTAQTAAAAKAADLADAYRRLDEATQAVAAAANAEKEALVRMSPLSVLVSKKDRRIYVRQGLAPLFDAPAIVRDPETPLGSHLYIATAVEGDGTSLKWSVVSLPVRGGEERGGGKTASLDERIGAPPKPHGSASSAAEALERIEIAQDVRDRIAERLWTGGSLIISDQPLSGETGAVGTDLTVNHR